MDINTLRGLITLLLLVGFIGLCFWAYSGRRKAAFEEAERVDMRRKRQLGLARRWRCRPGKHRFLELRPAVVQPVGKLVERQERIHVLNRERIHAAIFAEYRIHQVGR